MGPGQKSQWIAGAGVADITPRTATFLFGYPHVQRISTGVHDPLLASALYLSDGRQAVIWIANDLIWVPKAIVAAARRRITEATGVADHGIMVTATHTHCGPVTSRMLSNESDPVVPPPAPEYLQQLEDALVEAAVRAHQTAQPATLAFAMADGSAVGTNRRDPAGPAIPQVPVLFCRHAQSDQPIAVMAVCSMHPTVLHEDTTLVSGDFPGLARRYLQQATEWKCPFVYHMGASGNQSPRHVTKGNTFSEAMRLGTTLGQAIVQAGLRAQPIQTVRLQHATASCELPLRTFPAFEEAKKHLHNAAKRLESLRADGAPSAQVRTAECDLFGAEETVTLAQAAVDGRVQQAARSCTPACVQVFAIGETAWVGWPGEVFVEFALQVMHQWPRTYVLTLSNGDLQGYLVTAEAAAEGGYEASNALFQSPDSADLLVETTGRLMQQLRQ